MVKKKKMSGLIILLLIIGGLFLITYIGKPRSGDIQAFVPNSPVRVISGPTLSDSTVNPEDEIPVAAKVIFSEEGDYVVEIGLLLDGCYLDRDGNKKADCVDLNTQSFVQDFIVTTNICGWRVPGERVNLNNHYRNDFINVRDSDGAFYPVDETINIFFENLWAKLSGEYDLILSFSNDCYYTLTGNVNPNYEWYGSIVLEDAVIVGGGDRECDTSSDCTLQVKPYCVAGRCKQCREPGETTDCNTPGEICSLEYSCQPSSGGQCLSGDVNECPSGAGYNYCVNQQCVFCFPSSQRNCGLDNAGTQTCGSSGDWGTCVMPDDGGDDDEGLKDFFKKYGLYIFGAIGLLVVVGMVKG